MLVRKIERALIGLFDERVQIAKYIRTTKYAQEACQSFDVLYRVLSIGPTGLFAVKIPRLNVGSKRLAPRPRFKLRTFFLTDTDSHYGLYDQPDNQADNEGPQEDGHDTDKLTDVMVRLARLVGDPDECTAIG